MVKSKSTTIYGIVNLVFGWYFGKIGILV